MMGINPFLFNPLLAA